MDSIYIGISVIFMIIIMLDYWDRYPKTEHFENNSDVDNINGPNLIDYSAISPSAVNIGGVTKNFSNFTKFGEYPSIPLCKNCKLDYDCVNYPYDIDNNQTYMNVCTRCQTPLNSRTYNGLDEPIIVAARSAGRPRVNRVIN
jgi:hypothetical protein